MSQKFLSLIDAEGGLASCWPFLGSRMGAGYGQMPLNPVTRLAHRWVYTFFIGFIPKGKVVMHLCDVRSCCNPLHLKIGTQQDNLKDMNTKKRHGIHPRKCNQQTLNKILNLKNKGMPVSMIAKHVGYNKRTIFRLIAEHNQVEGI
jgi:hypothetical protein